MKSMTDIMAEMEAKRLSKRTEADGERAKFRQEFLDKNIDKCIVNFSGSGDSGSIDDITFEPEMKDEDLRSRIEAWSYKYLEGTGVDWYNNEGGQGTIEFEPGHIPMKFSATVEVNVVSTEVGFTTVETL